MLSSLRRRLRHRQESGFTLVELLISMVVFSILIAVILTLLINMMYQAKDNLGRQRAVEQARLGLSQIDRQIRSGNLILDPALDDVAESGVPPNYSLRIYTQEGGDDKCVQWRVIYYDTSGFGQLEFRSWEPADITTASSWSRVASNVVKPTASFSASDPESWPPFWVDSTLPSGTEAQNIRITLRMNDPDARSSAKPQALSSVVTGRNTVFGYSPLTCSTVPAP